MIGLILALSLVWSDGDSGRADGERFRLRGIDAPEISSAKCEMERELGLRAHEVVGALSQASEITIDKRYGPDQYGREVVDMSADGVDLVDFLTFKKVAKRWDYDGGQDKPEWCSEGLVWTSGTSGYYNGLKFKLNQVFAPDLDVETCEDDREWAGQAFGYVQNITHDMIRNVGFKYVDRDGFARVNILVGDKLLSQYLVERDLALVVAADEETPTFCQ